MATQNKPLLGYRQCPDCGERGSIHQAAGTRRQLYQRCGCGCVQSNGKLIQSRFWYETQWQHGLKPEQPPAVIYDQEEYLVKLREAVARSQATLPGQQAAPLPAQAEQVQVIEEAEESGQQADFIPADDPGADPAQPVKKSGGKWLLVLAGLGIGGLGLLASTSR